MTSTASSPLSSNNEQPASNPYTFASALRFSATFKRFFESGPLFHSLKGRRIRLLVPPASEGRRKEVYPGRDGDEGWARARSLSRRGITQLACRRPSGSDSPKNQRSPIPLRTPFLLCGLYVPQAISQGF
eukprot:Gb_36504 [translate_table: standard]